MKLNLVPARTGIQWVRSGVLTFFRQPLALSGLFFMFLAIISVTALIPFIGAVVGLALLPAATLGLMAATREARAGRFPMPTVLASAFRAGRERASAMWQLGAIYAIGLLLIMGVTTLMDGGSFARLYLVGGNLTRETLDAPGFQAAALTALALYLPLSLAFWHAPALVHWHGLSPAKSLFFSFVACLRNIGAFTVYALGWAALMMGAALVVSLVAIMLGQPAIAGVAMMPAMLLIACMFFTSVYFSFADCFVADEPTPGATP